MCQNKLFSLSLSLSLSLYIVSNKLLQYHLSAAPYHRTFNIITSPEFTSANKIFCAHIKLYYKAGKAKPKHKQSG